VRHRLGPLASPSRTLSVTVSDGAAGTGTKAAFDGYDLQQAPAPSGSQSWGDWFKSSAWGAAKWLTFGKLKMLEDIPKTIQHVGGLVGLTMDLTGEDKENILSVTMCECRTVRVVAAPAHGACVAAAKQPPRLEYGGRCCNALQKNGS
jgi:hypothetical protein